MNANDVNVPIPLNTVIAPSKIEGTVGNGRLATAEDIAEL